MYNPDKSKALHKAARDGDVLKIKELLNDPETDVNSIGGRGFTAFMRVCCANKVEGIRCFLECPREIDYNLRDCWGWPAISYIKKPDAVRLLCNDPRIDVNFMHHGKKVILMAAILWTDLDCIKELLACERLAPINVQDTFMGKTPLQFIKECTDFRMEYLIEDYISDPAATRERLQQELGCPKYQAAELFATIVLVCDDYYEIKEEE